MKQTEAIQHWQSGGRILVAEYRSSRIDNITWRDKSSGKAMSASLLKHTIELGDVSCVVSQRVPDDKRPEDYLGKFKKGDKVLFAFLTIQMERGAVSGTGELLPLAVA